MMWKPGASGTGGRWRRLVRVGLIAAVMACSARSGFAKTGVLNLGDGQVRFSFFAPEWIWQQQYINMILVLENDRSATTTIRTTLGFPPYHADRFGYEGPTSQVLVLGPGAQGRLAFANVLARDSLVLANGTRERFRPGFFVFRVDLEAESGGETARGGVDYPVRTVRGAVVHQGVWAMWLPVVLILVWCALLFLVVPPMAARGAWRLPSEPFEEDTAAPPAEPRAPADSTESDGADPTR